MIRDVVLTHLLSYLYNKKSTHISREVWFFFFNTSLIKAWLYEYTYTYTNVNLDAYTNKAVGPIINLGSGSMHGKLTVILNCDDYCPTTILNCLLVFWT